MAMLNQVKFTNPWAGEDWSVVFLCPDHMQEATDLVEFVSCRPEILLASPEVLDGMIPQCAWCVSGEVAVAFYGGAELN